MVIALSLSGGKKFQNVQYVPFNPPRQRVVSNNDMIENDDMEISDNFCDNTGIRKIILLCDFVDIMKKWIELLGNRFRLSMNTETKEILEKFQKHFKHEMHALNDNESQKELGTTALHTGNR